MIRLNVVVEGQAEETFIRELLGPSLANHGVFASARRVEIKKEGAQRRRGGGSHYAKWRKDLLTWMKQDDRANVWFTTMVDLYGLPRDFPGYEECQELRDAARRVAILEEQFHADLGHPRFIPYIQLHEFEALLFADVAKLVSVYPEHVAEIDRLIEMSKGFRTVDEIDDGRATAPSKRIRAILPQYDKTFAGILVAIDIGMERMCQASPHFKQWFDRLHRLDQPNQ
jgi:Domain of unknown function (DUF4276)